jgi:hypothetical protein
MSSISFDLGLSTAITTPYTDNNGSVYIINNNFTPAPLLSKNYTTTAIESIFLDTLGDAVQPNVTLTVDKDLSFVNGQRVVVTYNDINYFISRVLEYKGNKLKLDRPTTKFGSGTYSTWNISLDTHDFSNPTVNLITFKYFNNPANKINSGRITPLIFELFPIKSVYTYSFVPSKQGTDTNKTIYENMALKNTVQKKNNITLETINYNTNNAQIIFYPNTDIFKGYVFIRSMDTNNLNNYWWVDTSTGLVQITDPIQAIRLIELLNDAFKNNISNFITPFSKDPLIIDKYDNYKLIGVGNSIPAVINTVGYTAHLDGPVNNLFIVQSGTNILEYGKTYAFGWKDGSADTLQPPCISYDNKGLFPSLYLALNQKYSNQNFNKIINNIMPFDINLGAKAYPISFTVTITSNPDACISKNSNLIPSCPYGTQVCPLFTDKNLCYDPKENQMVTTYFDSNISFCPETNSGIKNNKFPYLIDNTRVYFTNDSILPCDVPYVSVEQKKDSSIKEGFNNYENNYKNYYDILLIIFIIIFFYITYKNN